MPYKDPIDELNYQRNRRKNNPAYNSAKNKKWKETHRTAYLAHKAVEYAIKCGKLLSQPCFCGAKAHAHHNDYNKPLEVIWLCPKHHKEKHTELRLLGIEPK